MKKLMSLVFCLTLLTAVPLTYSDNTEPMNEDYTEVILNNATVNVGDSVVISIYIIPQDGYNINLVELINVNFSADKLQCTGLSWGNFFESQVTEYLPTINNTAGTLNESQWTSDVNTSTPGYYYNMTFDTISPGTAYVEVNKSGCGIADGGEDRPETIKDSTITIQGEDSTQFYEKPDNPIYGAHLGDGKAYYPSVTYDTNQFSSHGNTSYYKMWYDPGDGTPRLLLSDDGVDFGSFSDSIPMTNLSNAYHPSVIYDSDGFGTGYYYRMYYWDGSVDLSTRVAESTDGINWVNDQLITQNSTYPLCDNICNPSGTAYWYHHYGPGNIYYNSSATNTGNNPWAYSFVMTFDTSSEGSCCADGSVEYTGLAYSTDGFNWTRYSNEPIIVATGESSEWDTHYAYHGDIVKISDNNWRMWYSGGDDDADGGKYYAEGIGEAFSYDGLTWYKCEDNPLFHFSDNQSGDSTLDWRSYRTYTANVIDNGENLLMYYTGDDSDNRSIGVAQDGGVDDDADPSCVYAGGANSKSVFEFDYDDLTKTRQTVNHTGNVWEVLTDDEYLYVATDNPANRVYKYDLATLTEQGNYSYGDDYIYAMAQDDEYIYAGGSWAVGRVHQIWKSNMTLKGETPAYGDYSNIWSISVDNDYIYVAGGLTRTVKRYQKSDLSYVDATANFGSEIYGVVLDDTYVYACGGKQSWSTGGEVRQYWQSNMTMKSSIDGLSGGISRSIEIDDTYVYAGGVENGLNRIWKSNMTERDNSSSYGGAIYALHIHGDYIYVGGGTTNRVYRYYLSNMTRKDESDSYGGTIYGIALGTFEPPNYMPDAFDEDPTDTDIDVSIFYNQVSVNITDIEGDNFNVFIHGNYLTNVSLYNQINGTFTGNLTPLPFDTLITWHVDIQSNSSTLANWKNYTFSFTTEVQNQAPVLGTPDPIDGATNTEVAFDWEISIIDPDDDLINWTIECSNGQQNLSFMYDVSENNVTEGYAKPKYVDVEGDYAVMARHENPGAVFLYDISEEEPRYIDHVSMNNGPNAVEMYGGYAYASLNTGLCVVMSYNETSISITDTVDGGGQMFNINQVNDNMDYVAMAGAEGDGLVIVNVTNKSNVSIESKTTFSAGGVDIKNDVAFITKYDSSELRAYDISNQTSPLLLDSISVGSMVVSVRVYGNYAYVQEYSGSNFYIVDISDPSNMSMVLNGYSVAQVPNAGGIYVDTVEDLLYHVSMNNGNIHIFNISDKTNPNLLTKYQYSGSPTLNTIDVNNQYIYVPHYSDNKLSVLVKPDMSSGTKTLSLSGLDYSTTYTVYVNATDGSLSTNESFTFTTKANTPPSIGSPTPTNNSINQSLSLTWSVPVDDPEHNITTTIECTNGDSITYTDVSPDTYSLDIDNLDYSTTYTVYVNSTDGIDTTREWFIFTTLASTPPETSNPNPYNGETDVSIEAPNFEIQIADSDGDTFDWSIECSNGESFSDTADTDGTKFCWFPEYLDYNTTYTVWVNVTENTNTAHSLNEVYTFTTEENTPPTVELNFPLNQTDYLSVYNLIFNCTISDTGPEDLTVEFYINNSVTPVNIGYVYNATTGEVEFHLNSLGGTWWLTHFVTHEWWVVVDDGTTRVESEHWTFGTSAPADINEDREVDYLDISALVAVYGESGFLPGEIGEDIVEDGVIQYQDVSALVFNYLNIY